MAGSYFPEKNIYLIENVNAEEEKSDKNIYTARSVDTMPSLANL